MNFRLPQQLEHFVAREATIKAIKEEEIARMVALATKNGGQLTDGQRRACLERFADRIAAARTSVYKRSLDRLFTGTPGLTSATEPGGTANRGVLCEEAAA